MMGFGLTVFVSLTLWVCGSTDSPPPVQADPQTEKALPVVSSPGQPESASDPNQPAAPSQPLQESEPAAKEPVQTDPSVEKSEQLQRQVRMLQLSAMDPNQTPQGNSLKQMIEQLQSLQLPAETADTKASSPDEPKTESKPVVQPQPTLPISNDPIQTGLARLDQVAEPLNAIAVADALFRLKDHARAMRFYEVAIDTAKSSVMERQWAMYQSANCMRYQDADRAVELYGRLIAEYPNSPWSSAALSQRKTLEWLKKNQAELKQRIAVNDPNSL